MATLHDAAADGHVGDVERLLRDGDDPNERDAEGATPILLAVRKERLDVVERLVAAGARLDAHDPKAILLMWTRPYPKNDPREPTGRATLLHEAAQRDATGAIIRSLVKHGVSVNARDRLAATPLHHAAYFNRSPGALRTLIELGAEIHARDAARYAPLDHALLRAANVEVLLAAGADPRGAAEPSDPRPESAKLLGTLARATDAAVPMLLKAGVHPSEQPDAIGWHANRGSDDVVRALLGAGARTSDARPNQLPPLAQAVSTGRLSTVKLLLEAGAEDTVDAALEQAAWWETTFDDAVEIVRLLVARAPSREALSHALSNARRAGSSRTVELLLAAGADPKVEG